MRRLLAIALVLPLALAAQSTGDVLLGSKSATGGLTATWVTKTSSRAIGWDSSGNLTAIALGSGGTWGSITGTLSAQTDLQSALNARLAAASNLSDLANAATARSNLGLGTLATQNGTISDYLTTASAASTYEPLIAAGTTAQYWRGDKSWQTLNAAAVGLGSVSNALQLVAANNLSDLANAATARTNLGLGTLATQNGTISDYLTTATAASTYQTLIAAGTTAQYWRGDKSWQTLNAAAVGLGSVSNALQLVAANNLSDLANAATARTNLSLGTLATQNANEVEITGGDITGINSVAIVGASGLSIGNNIGTAGIISLYDGAGFLATIQTAVLSDFQALTLPDATGTFITTGNLSSITATGTITSGTWNGSTIAIANGGTGATTASAARIALLPSMTGNGGKFLRVNAGATDYELATISGGGDALTSGTLDQFADVTQTATKTLAITDSTTLAGGTHSGTNTGDVTLAGTPDYITISGQTITRGSVDLTTDVTGTLPLANGGTAASLTDPNADRILFWDDSAGGVTWLEAGSGLSISGTTITASGGSSSTVSKYVTASQDIDTTALEDVTDLSFTVASGTRYAFKFVVFYNSSAAGEGLGLAVNGPSSPTTVQAAIAIYHSTAGARFGAVSAYETTVLNGTGIVAGSYATVDGYLITGASGGTFVLRARTDTAAASAKNTITAGFGTLTTAPAP